MLFVHPLLKPDRPSRDFPNTGMQLTKHKNKNHDPFYHPNFRRTGHYYDTIVLL